MRFCPRSQKIRTRSMVGDCCRESCESCCLLTFRTAIALTFLGLRLGNRKTLAGAILVLYGCCLLYYNVRIGRERGWGRLVLLSYCMCIGLVVLGRVI
ncbi:hypothetical protein MTR67_014044 [Solanum verrucosum]|uniref:Uncharacterized protein n=1 Tax=Solanum verrucosum TaxID=315347 RepID=A0AAF0QIQ6_SOLVR|nr:hypothetical protein MTR67_014044 [Solanum verrucosum]